jgi:hypothetical protein
MKSGKENLLLADKLLICKGCIKFNINKHKNI